MHFSRFLFVYMIEWKGVGWLGILRFYAYCCTANKVVVRAKGLHLCRQNATVRIEVATSCLRAPHGYRLHRGMALGSQTAAKGKDDVWKWYGIALRWSADMTCNNVAIV